MPEKPVKSTKNKLFNFVTNIIYIHKKENGICVQKASKFHDIQAVLFRYKYHLLHKKKNKICTWKARKINENWTCIKLDIIPHYIHKKKNGIAPHSPWFYWIVGLYAFPKNQRTDIYYTHKKKNGICVVKACKINRFKSFLNQTFPCCVITDEYILYTIRKTR